MSTIDSINNTAQYQNTTENTSTTENTTLDSFAFLELFLVQLQNQDPTSPMDSADMASQLCSFSQLDQQQQTNEYLEQLIAGQQSAYNSQAIQLIGKSVVAEGSSVSVQDGEASSIVLDLDDSLSEAVISIFDDEGEQVAEFTAEDLSSGWNFIEWDGLDDEGQAVADGEYTYEVAASSDEESDVGIDTYSSLAVLSVLFRDNEAYLVSQSGQEINFNDVVQVL